MHVASPVSQHSHSLGHSLDSNTHTRLDLHSVYANTLHVDSGPAEAHEKKSGAVLDILFICLLLKIILLF